MHKTFHKNPNYACIVYDVNPSLLKLVGTNMMNSNNNTKWFSTIHLNRTLGSIWTYKTSLPLIKTIPNVLFYNLWPKVLCVFQEQYKCVYDTLEEYVVCGTSFFYVHQLSERLKQKSLKERSSKKQRNEYEREYSVSTSF